MIHTVFHFPSPDPAQDDDAAPYLLIGHYADAATAAVAALGDLPGFRDWPHGFRIFRRHLGETFGTQGFPAGCGEADWARSLGTP